jgi:tetrahydromethanopterin S-methyltransferase subunit C
MSKQETQAIETTTITEMDRTTVQVDALKFMYESQQKWFWQMLDALIKGAAFYLTITAAVIGYVLAKELPATVQRSILIIGILTSVLFVIAATACCRGLHACLTPIEKSIKSLDVEVAEGLNLPHVFTVMRRVMWAVAVCSFLVFIMILVGMIILYRQMG